MSSSFSQSSIDGVRFLCAERSGTAYAALVFRAGMGDVPAAKQGLCHLLEHLAMSKFDDWELDCNAKVDHFSTTFMAKGSIDEVTAFIHGVTTSLSDLPYERLDREKQILGVEGDDEIGVLGSLARCRFGVIGLGAHTLNEVGLADVTVEDLEEFRSKYFVRENAILCSTFHPEDIDFASLPNGVAQPEPPLNVRQLEPPGVFEGPDDLICFSMSVNRSPAAVAFGNMTMRRLLTRGRTELGLTYSVEAEYIPVSRDKAEVFWFMDTKNQHADRLLVETLDLLDCLKDSGFTADELAVFKKRSEPQDELSFVAAELESRALLLLMDSEDPTSNFEAVTLSEVHEVARAAIPSLVITVPEGTADSKQRLHPVLRITPEATIDGDLYRSMLTKQEMPSLFVGSEAFGLRYEDGSGDILKVPYENVVLHISYDDTSVKVVDVDGNDIYLHPAWFKNGSYAMAQLEGHLDSSVKLRRRKSDLDLDSSDELINRFVLWTSTAVLSVCLLVIAISIGYVVSADRQNSELLGSGARVQATVVRDIPEDDVPGTYKPLPVRFVTENGQQVSTTVNVMYDVAFAPESRVDIVYDRNDPQNVVAVSDSFDPASDRVSIPVITAVLLSLFAAAGLAFSLRRRRLWRSDERTTMLIVESPDTRLGRSVGLITLFDPQDPSTAVATMRRRLNYQDLAYTEPTEADVIGRVEIGNRVLIETGSFTAQGKLLSPKNTSTPRISAIRIPLAGNGKLLWATALLRLSVPLTPLVCALAFHFSGDNWWSVVPAFVLWSIVSSKPFEWSWKSSLRRMDIRPSKAQVKLAMRAQAADVVYGSSFANRCMEEGIDRSIPAFLAKRAWPMSVVSAVGVLAVLTI